MSKGSKVTKVFRFKVKLPGEKQKNVIAKSLPHLNSRVLPALKKRGKK